MGRDGKRACRARSLAEERARVARLLAEETSARSKGYRAIAGIDEAGRGCLAGPVYAAAVVLDPDAVILGLDDSKLLPAEVREALSGRIWRGAKGVGVGAASAAEIDALGIARANELAMRRAVLALPGGLEPDLLLIDAVHLPGEPVEQRSFIKGDRRIAAIAAASIVAKVARDRFMDELHRLFPFYGFDTNRGYGTPAHLAALKRHGPSPAHRLTFDRVVASKAPTGGRRAVAA